MFPGTTMASSLPSTSRHTLTLTLYTKVNVIHRKERGQKNCDICLALGLPESTARTILSNKNDIMKCVKAYGSSSFDNCKTSGQVQLVKTECFLALWVDRKESEGVDLDKRDIIDKARLL